MGMLNTLSEKVDILQKNMTEVKLITESDIKEFNLFIESAARFNEQVSSIEQLAEKIADLKLEMADLKELVLSKN